PHYLEGHRREALATVAEWLAARLPRAPPGRRPDPLPDPPKTLLCALGERPRAPIEFPTRAFPVMRGAPSHSPIDVRVRHSLTEGTARHNRNRCSAGPPWPCGASA